MAQPNTTKVLKMTSAQAPSKQIPRGPRVLCNVERLETCTDWGGSEMGPVGSDSGVEGSSFIVEGSFLLNIFILIHFQIAFNDSRIFFLHGFFQSALSFFQNSNNIPEIASTINGAITLFEMSIPNITST